jgi:pyruvate dehydrogenase E1 component alpha subunit
MGSTSMSTSTLRDLYVGMLRIRVAEERIAEAIQAGEVRTPCHLYIGQEAVAVGACAALRPTDYAWITYRSHGQFLAKGGDMRGMFAEIYGKSTGVAHGRGGSMHLVDPAIGVLGTTAMVAGPLPLAVGTALATRLRGDGRVTAVFFGDGATDEGVFWESVNFAALSKLPVVFVCENNLYASAMPLLERTVLDNLHERVAAFGLASHRIDGNDVELVRATVSAAVATARDGGGPSFIECRTYRHRGHVGPNWDLDKGLRSRAELDSWLARDPIQTARARLLGSGEATEKDLEGDDLTVRAEVEDALRFARESPYPDPKGLAVLPGGRA